MNSPADDIIYDPEAVRIGLLLYPPKVCSSCGMRLPANGDYFRWDKSNGSFKSACRRCTRLRDRAYNARRRQER